LNVTLAIGPMLEVVVDHHACYWSYVRSDNGPSHLLLVLYQKW